MLPMGTIVTCCMLIGLVLATGVMQKAPALVKLIGGAVVGLAGAWNLLWYTPQNLTHFWGWAALVSGILMVITAFYIAAPDKLPPWLRVAKPVVMLALLACALKYAWTIYNL